MEKIIRIEPITFKTDDKDYSSYEGLQVITDKQTIKVGIEDGQSCCERAGFVTSEDNFAHFEGAELIKVEVVDESLKVCAVPDIYDGGCMFVNFTTSKGLLQFVAYNEHNGYYSHEAVLISRDVNHEERL